MSAQAKAMDILRMGATLFPLIMIAAVMFGIWFLLTTVIG